MKPHLRKDILSSNWVIISDERQFRPNEYISKVKCPFCPGNEEETPPEIYSLRDKKGWFIRVVPNKYPALLYDDKNFVEEEGINKKNYLNGIHEVIIEDRIHSIKIHKIKHLDQVLNAYAFRMKELYRRKTIKYVMIFKNYGKNAGASLVHPHSQIIALPILPYRIVDEVNHFEYYYKKNKRCAMCDIIKNEIKIKKRVISLNDDFIAFAPFASRFNFEIWIAPRKHIINFYELNNYNQLALIIKDVFYKLHKSIEGLSYNMIIHSSPRNSKNFHLHIEILPKLAMPAGFEWGSGFYINTISPEKVSEILKSNKKFSLHRRYYENRDSGK